MIKSNHQNFLLINVEQQPHVLFIHDFSSQKNTHMEVGTKAFFFVKFFIQLFLSSVT